MLMTRGIFSGSLAREKFGFFRSTFPNMCCDIDFVVLYEVISNKLGLRVVVFKQVLRS